MLRGVPPPGVFRGLSVSFSLTCCIQWLRFPLAQTTWLPRGIASTHRPSRHRTPSTARATDRAPTRPLRPGQDEADTEAAGAQAAEGEARCRSASRPPPTQAGSALRLTSIMVAAQAIQWPHQTGPATTLSNNRHAPCLIQSPRSAPQRAISTHLLRSISDSPSSSSSCGGSSRGRSSGSSKRRRRQISVRTVPATVRTEVEAWPRPPLKFSVLVHSYLYK